MFVSLSLGYLTQYVFLVPPTLGGLFKNNKEPAVVVDAFDPSTCEAEAGGSL